MSFASLTQRVGQIAIRHSPTILTSVGVVGAITTAALVGKASFEAADLIRLDEESGGTAGDPKQRFKERFRLVWKLYIPAATMGTVSIACIVGGNRIGASRAAAGAAAAAIVERAYEEYKDKVVEKFGERKEEQVRDEINQDRMALPVSNADLALFDVAEGKLCYDKFSGRYFRGSVEGIQAAVNSLNNCMNHDMTATLGDFYRLLDMEVTAYSDRIGWNHDRLLEVRCGSALAHDSVPCIVMEFRNDPTEDYTRFRHI